MSQFWIWAKEYTKIATTISAWVLLFIVIGFIGYYHPILLVTVASILVVTGIFLVFYLQWLGKRSVLFTNIQEGTAKAIMRGNSFDRMIMSYKGHHLNVRGQKGYRKEFDDWEVVYHGPNNENKFDDPAEQDDARYDRRPWLLKKLGLYWVGWPWASKVYIYEFEWNETITTPEGNEEILTRREATDFIYVSDFPYGIVSQGTETYEALSTRVIVIITVAVKNPYKALFRVQDWMRRITAPIIREIRVYIGTKTYQELISSREDASDNSDLERKTRANIRALSTPILRLNEILPDDAIPEDEKKEDETNEGIEKRYGIFVNAADLLSIVLSGQAKGANETATTKRYVASQEAEAIRLTGKADADVIEMKGKKEAEALKAKLEIINTNGEAGLQLALSDNMRDAAAAGNTIIWANSGTPPLTPVLPIDKPNENR